MANIDFYTKKNLYTEISSALNDSVSGLSSSSKEPEFIANVACKFPIKLTEILNKCVPGLAFKTCGCFIHNSPKMKFCDTTIAKKGAELGDLLIVYKEESKDGDKLYNALLLQAKKIDYAKTVDKRFCSKVSGNPTQLILYTKWPRFRYTQPASLSKKTRDIYPKTIHNGAQYLLINPYQPVVEFWCATANPELCASVSLASQIISLIEFQSGDAFVLNPPVKMDDWSSMIMDLLYMTRDSVFNLKGQFNGEKRMSKNPSTNKPEFTLEDLMEAITDCKEQCKIEEGNNNCGISLICIEGKRNNENKRK